MDEEPAEENTEHVDGSYANGDSDGSADRPWTSMAAGLAAAADGAMVAVDAVAVSAGLEPPPSLAPL